jgi:serine protease Do
MGRRNWWFSIGAVILLAAVAWLAAASSLLAQDPQEVSDAVGQAKSLSTAFRKAAEATMPSVVTIVASPSSDQRIREFRELLNDPRFRRLLPEDFDLEQQFAEDRESILPPGFDSQVGSGIVIDSSGVILTNNHVIESAGTVTVRFGDGREVKATEIKADPKSDLAIIRIPATSDLKAARMGDSSELQIGDWVIAIGSPFELEMTVSAGIISGLISGGIGGQGRGLGEMQRGSLLQTDAAINPGNSGGPLVSLDGEVVGINMAIASNTGGYQGIGFAIPANRAKWVAEELVNHGTVRRAYLGIRIDELGPEAAEALQVPPRSGVFVADVLPGGSADDAGLRINDVITEFAGRRVRGPRELQDLVEQKPVHSQQTLAVIRRGALVRLQVTLKPYPLD